MIPAQEDMDLLRNVAVSVVKNYPQCDAEDVTQTLYLAWYEKYPKIEAYLDMHVDARTALLVKVFRNVALDYCRREANELDKIHRSRSDDAYYYSRKQITDMLPFVENPERWSSLAAHGPKANGKSNADPANGGDILAHYADLRTAWDCLSESDREVLRRKFVLQYEYAEIADATGSTEAVLRKRVERAVTRMQKRLGQDRRSEVHEGRRAVSNATAQVMTRRGYDGE